MVTQKHKKVVRGHSRECRLEQEAYRKAIKVFTKKFPDWCWSCRGSGVVEWTENGAPHGEGFWPMPMPDYCEDCVCKGRCPRCGKESRVLTESGEELKCELCGWNWGKEKDDYPPDVPECDCFIRRPNI